MWSSIHYLVMIHSFQLISAQQVLVDEIEGNIPHFDSIQTPLVKMPCGDIRGEIYLLDDGSLGARYLGIPYAKPPIGKRRFADTEYLPPWKGILDGNHFGAMCIQPSDYSAQLWDIEATHVENGKDNRTEIQEELNKFVDNDEMIEKITNFFSIEKNSTNSSNSSVNEISYSGTMSPEMLFESMRRNRILIPNYIGNYKMDEDCLSLNIYAPMKSDREKNSTFPVILYIHGGSYYVNSGRLYPGERLASEGYIVVTINYRLGPFGFLSTGDEFARGNWGMKDQLMALKWIHTNIHAFSGDSSRILLMGNSAGAAAALMHLYSPLSKGLFSRVIALSGCSTAYWAIRKDPLRSAKKLAEFLHCPVDSNKDMIDCMRSFKWQEIRKNMISEAMVNVVWLPMFTPVIEGDVPNAFLPIDPAEILEKGEFYKIPIIISLTKDEFSIWFKESYSMEKLDLEGNIHDMILEMYPNLDNSALDLVIQSVRNRYIYSHEKSHSGMSAANPRILPDDTLPSYILANFYSDLELRVPCLEEARLLSKSSPTYLILFSHKSSDDIKIQNKDWIGSYHESDLQYIFGLPLMGIQNSLTEEDDRDVSRIMMDIVGSFATNGTPTSRWIENVTWSQFVVDDTMENQKAYLNISISPEIGHDLERETLDFWLEMIPSTIGLAETNSTSASVSTMDLLAGHNLMLLLVCHFIYFL